MGESEAWSNIDASWILRVPIARLPSEARKPPLVPCGIPCSNSAQANRGGYGSLTLMSFTWGCGCSWVSFWPTRWVSLGNRPVSNVSVEPIQVFHKDMELLPSKFMNLPSPQSTPLQSPTPPHSQTPSPAPLHPTPPHSQTRSPAGPQMAVAQNPVPLVSINIGGTLVHGCSAPKWDRHRL